MRRVLRNFIVSTPGTRTNFRGHYATVNHYVGGDDNSYITMSIGGKRLWQANLVGVQHRVKWKDVEPTKASSTVFGHAGYTYDFSRVTELLDEIVNGGHVGAGAGGKPQMLLMIEDKVFYSGAHPLPQDAFPDYLFTEGFTSARANAGHTNSESFRSDPYVSGRYRLLITAMAAWRDATFPNGYDVVPNFEGVTIQESAIGFGDNPAAGGEDTNYTATRYATAIKDMIQVNYDLFPRCRPQWFVNFITGGQNGTPNKFDDILDNMVANAPLAYFGGPDILHTNASLNKQGANPEGIYQYYLRYKDLLLAGGSMQNDSYSEAIPGGGGASYTMTQQYNLAAALAGETTTGAHPHQLFCKRVYWDFHAGSPYDWSDAVAVIDANTALNIAGTVKA